MTTLIKLSRLLNKSIKIFIIFLLAATSKNFAQEADNIDQEKKIAEMRHAINTCPFGIAFGIFSANYQYLHNNRHGFVFRVDYENIPGKYSDADIDAFGAAVLFNYRYHIDPTLNSCFVGTFVRGRMYKGTGELNGKEYDFDIPEFTIGVNAGRRWVWECGLTATFMLGYGYNTSERNISPDSVNFEKYVKDFENEYNFAGGFLGELSIGYAF